ncbi:MAG: metallophosphoesterase [Planctomycetota bacterium]
MGGRHFYRTAFLNSGKLRIRREDVAIPSLPVAADGLTIVQLTDFHGGSFLHASDLARVIDITNQLNPDLIVLTGDFLTHITEEALEIVPALAKLRAAKGVFAVFGNHDYRGRREGEIERALAAVGIKTLRNRNVMIVPGLALAGIEDLEEGKYPDFDAALAGIHQDTTIILLSHHPAGLYFAAQRGVHLVFSGHTHGNQVQWPILKNLGPRHPGDRVVQDKTILLVSHGIGVIGVPFRAGARPEILVAALRRGER